jgi:hypothetical protein
MQVTKFNLSGTVFTEDENKKYTWIKEAKVMFDNKKQLLCSNNLSL